VSWQPPSEDWQSALDQPDDWQKQLRKYGTAAQTPVWRSPEPEAAPAPPGEPVAGPPAEPAPAAPAEPAPAAPAERPWRPAARIDVRPSAAGAGAALALGIVGLGFWFLGPFAWWLGARARRAIRRSDGQLGGYGTATAGMVLGIVETVGVILFTLLIVIGILVAAPEQS
jgi:Domain of unknown function (DUF4190)